jgi:hypothetical protein
VGSKKYFEGSIHKGLEILERLPTKPVRFKVRCTRCGEISEMVISVLSYRKAQFCTKCAIELRGEKKRKTLDKGSKFGRLTVLEDAGVKGRRWYKCVCDCGKEVSVRRNSLVIGETTSCGCLKVDNTITRNKSNEVFWPLGTVIDWYEVHGIMKPTGKRTQYLLKNLKTGTYAVWTKGDFVRRRNASRKVSNTVRNGITRSLQGRGKRGVAAAKILGVTVETAIEILTGKFQEGMSWDNYGVSWQVDHICPVSLAETYEEAVKLNHICNLQPMWSSDNGSKGAKWTEKGAHLHKKLLGREWVHSNGSCEIT